MGRSLQSIGWIILVAAVGLLLAGVLGWVPERAADAWGVRGLFIGSAFLGGGLFLSVTAPLTRMAAGTRCVRCRRRIERGQTYCMDHLREALNEYRDRKGARHPAG